MNEADTKQNILNMLAKGKRVKHIANELHLSLAKVYRLITILQYEHGALTDCQLIAIACKKGLIS